MKPIVHGLEQKWSGQVAFVRVNTDTSEGQALAQKYGIDAIPAFVFIDRNGKPARQVQGGQEAAVLEGYLKELTGKG